MNLVEALLPIQNGLIDRAEKQMKAEIQTAKGAAMRSIAALEKAIQDINEGLAVTVDECEAEFEANKAFILSAFSGDTSDDHVEKDDVIINLPEGAESKAGEILNPVSASENA